VKNFIAAFLKIWCLNGWPPQSLTAHAMIVQWVPINDQRPWNEAVILFVDDYAAAA
jgi:hypothetical protein